MDFQAFVALLGCSMIVYAAFRLIYDNTHNKSNVNLTHWMLTGGAPALLTGFVTGLINCLNRHFDRNARHAIILLIGVMLMLFAVKILGN